MKNMTLKINSPEINAFLSKQVKFIRDKTETDISQLSSDVFDKSVLILSKNIEQKHIEEAFNVGILEAMSSEEQKVLLVSKVIRTGGISEQEFRRWFKINYLSRTLSYEVKSTEIKFMGRLLPVNEKICCSSLSEDQLEIFKSLINKDIMAGLEIYGEFMAAVRASVKDSTNIKTLTKAIYDNCSSFEVFTLKSKQKIRDFLDQVSEA